MNATAHWPLLVNAARSQTLGRLVVNSCCIMRFVDGPAWQLLQPGDVILSVNQVDVSDVSREDVIKLIKYRTFIHYDTTIDASWCSSAQLSSASFLLHLPSSIYIVYCNIGKTNLLTEWLTAALHRVNAVAACESRYLSGGEICLHDVQIKNKNSKLQ